MTMRWRSIRRLVLNGVFVSVPHLLDAAALAAPALPVGSVLYDDIHLLVVGRTLLVLMTIRNYGSWYFVGMICQSLE
jgi:hypothetical protein